MRSRSPPADCELLEFDIRPDTQIGSGPVPLAIILDTKAPVITRARIAKLFRLGRKPTPVNLLRKVKVGAAFTYRLSEPATVRIALSRCKRQVRRKCRRYRRVKTLLRQGRAGFNRNAFSGRIRGVKGRTGRFRATLTATDAAGNTSAASRLAFRIVRR